MTLSGKTAFITGGTMGLGCAIADAYRAAGAKVFVMARHATGRDFYAGDVSREIDVHFAVAKALVQLGHIDILVNNAAVHGPRGCLWDVDVDEWRYALGVNLVGPLLTMQALIPHMRKRGSGKIINLSGGGATKAMPDLSAYAASKAALVRLTETVAVELAGTGIDVNAVAPGHLKTRLTAGETHFNDTDEAAALCVWLASSESDGITGRLVSAVWDEWRTLRQRWDVVGATDYGMLRRVE